MKNFRKTWLLITVLFICSCAGKEHYSEEMQASSDKAPAPVNETHNGSKPIAERKIIKEGEISFQTPDLNGTGELIAGAVRELDGYVSNENISVYGGQVSHHLTVRVPSGNFDLLLSMISQNVDEFDSKNINARDVTEEYIDVSARIKTKKEVENRFMELLRQAATVEDILKIETEIGKLRTEIESAEGRLRFLSDRISLSTLSITYYQDVEPSFGFSSKFTDALTGGWNGLMSFVIGLVHIWPFLLVIAIAGVIYLRIRKKRT